MLTAAREIKANGTVIARTPALVPSFSSKGFPEVAKIIETLAETITESTLISAYDIAREHITSIPTFPSYFILDSGGYECSKDMELSDTRMNNLQESPWAIEELAAVLDAWKAPQPTLAVSFDHPKLRVSIDQQIQRAIELFAGRPFGRVLLIKPISTEAERIDHKAVISAIRELHHFDVIGFTEKDIGFSIFDRMRKIAKIRRALSEVGLNTPIHIFGSLDPVTTPLYFFAGADIFDGLTWLRYGYSDGQAVYGRNLAALKHGLRTNDKDIDPIIWSENYQAIVDLQIAMKRYLKEGNFSAFGPRHEPFFEKAVKEMHADD